MTDSCLAATLMLVLGCPLAAQRPDSVLGVVRPIEKLQCRLFRSNDVRIEFDDGSGARFKYLINLHFMSGDGRVYRIRPAEKRTPIGMQGEAELLSLLSAWSEANITKADRERLTTVAADAWTPEDRDHQEILAAIHKLRSLPPGIALIGKGKGYVIHALPSPPAAWRSNVARAMSSGIGLTYTDLGSGRMRYLTEPTGTVSIDTRRISYHHTRLVGVTLDDERLYAVLWRSQRLWSPPRDSEVPLPDGAYWLQVFWLKDGSKIHESGLATATLPERSPPESIGRGPLVVTNGTVSCYGAVFRFRGKDLAR